jgi:hypothetical protein
MSEETAQLNPSIVVLRTGEKLITILQEVYDGEGEDRKGVCLVMNYPYTLELLKIENEDNAEQDLQVKYSKWCPYSIENTFRIPYDGILTFGSADPGLAQAYIAKVEYAKSLENANAELQQKEIQEVLNSQQTPTAGVGADTDKHPIAEPFEQVDEEPAVTPEVV